MAQVSGGAPVAVVPLKALDQAKGRLAGHLDDAGRRELTGWMFARVVSACRRSTRVGRLLVVAGDDAAAARATALGVDVLVEPRPGLPAAMALADRAVETDGASLVVAADLPLADAAELDTLCAVGEDGPCVVVTPTRDGGTAILLRRPPGVIPTAFGEGSAAEHLRAARDAGVRAVRLDLPGLSFDVDTAEDLRAAGARDQVVARWISGLSAGWGRA